MSHDHSHNHQGGGRQQGGKVQLVLMMTMTFSFFLVELIVGQLTRSTALVADSFHMLSDVLALVVAFVAILMSPRLWARSTFGWARAEVLGALVNAVFLIALCLSILIEAVERFLTPEPLQDPVLVLIVGCVGLGINLVGLLLFKDHHGHSHSHSDKASNDKSGHEVKSNKVKQSSMNLHGVFLHVLADALGSVVVIISALVVNYTDWEYNDYVDPTLSIVIVILIVTTTIPLLKSSSLILLQTSPVSINHDELKASLLNMEPIEAVHELHVWQLVGDRLIATVHLLCHESIVAEHKNYMAISAQVKRLFHEAGIHSTTVQLEFVGSVDDAKQTCQLKCSPSLTNCAQNQCCFDQAKTTQKCSSLTDIHVESNLDHNNNNQ